MTWIGVLVAGEPGYPDVPRSNRRDAETQRTAGFDQASLTSGDSKRGSSPLAVITGPTAAGKSAIAMAIAEARTCSIISADSRQVYREFDIGTAKPSRAEMAAIPHYGIDVIDPTERYSAHRWSSDSIEWMHDARVAGRTPLIVGGTGFYIRALVRPLDDVPELDTERRARLERWLDGLDAESLQRWTARLDPDRAASGRTQRLRAVETAVLTGLRLSEHFGGTTGTRAVHYLVIDPGERLAGRIRQRVFSMFDNGWSEEVRDLCQRWKSDAPAWKASGYQAMRDYVEGRITREEGVERIIIETRQYAKRQRTWCRNQLVEGPVTRIDPDAPDALQRALEWWDMIGTGEEART